MSTKTNFKRIALVAVAALGLGVLSSVPSSAAPIGTISLTTTNSTSTTIAKSDTTTAATVTVRWLAGVATADSVALSGSINSRPATATTPAKLLFTPVDTLTSVSNATFKPTDTTGAATVIGVTDTAVVTAGNVTAPAYVAATFLVHMDSATGTRVAGTYIYTITATPSSVPAGPALSPVTAEVTFTIAALASESKVASPANSSAIISAAGGGATDEVVSGVATASTTPTAIIEVKLRNASSATTGTAARESVTVTTTAGTVGIAGGTFGRSVVLQYNTTDSISVQVRPDGTAATAAITVSSPSVTFANKSVVFYSAAPTSIVASVLNSTPGIGTTTLVIGVVATDANKNPWAGSLYAYSDTLATISDTGTSCSYVAANSRHECSVTGVAAGTAKVTMRSKAAADAGLSTTVSSNAVSLTISAAVPATVKLTFDKASYAPGEKATLLVSVSDSTGKSVPAATFANLFATGGISLSTAAGNGSDTVTAVSVMTVSLASYALGTLTDPVKAYTIYMPSSGGTFKATATGGSSLPLAGQVAVSATATVTDSGSAALAAVTALATTVASLKTLITTLTNLVLKIQKKVKA